MQTTELPQAGYTLRQAAEIIGYRRQSVYRLVEQNKLESYVGTDGRLMITREEIYRFLKQMD